jgi:RNA-directed DNA polymerase
VSLSTPQKLQRLQESLYAKAKQELDCRFHFLYDKVYREDILSHAYALSRSNGGAPGVDGQSFADVGAYGEERWLQELKEDLQEERYRAQAVRRVMIPKASGIGERPLGIPTIRDRVVQTAVKLILEPIFEADFDEAAHGYRPGRNAQQAVQKVHQALLEGRTEVVDADVSKYFDTIPHAELMKSLMRRISDGKILRLLKMWLKVPIEEINERGNRRMSGGKKANRGTPQGGVISPLLANIYMHRFIKAFRKYSLDKKYGATLVNYADDLVVLCRRGARQVLEDTRRWMTRMGLALNEEKTCVRDGRCERFDFLGYTFGSMHSPRTGGRYLGAVPSKKAVTRLKEKVRQQLRPNNLAPIEQVVDRLNRTVRGWASYFCYGTLMKVRTIVDEYVYEAMRNFLRRRHKVSSRGYRQFSEDMVFGQLGVVSAQKLPKLRFANALV